MKMKKYVQSVLIALSFMFMSSNAFALASVAAPSGITTGFLDNKKEVAVKVVRQAHAQIEKTPEMVKHLRQLFGKSQTKVN